MTPSSILSNQSRRPTAGPQRVVLVEFHLGNADEAEKPLRSHVEEYGVGGDTDIDHCIQICKAYGHSVSVVFFAIYPLICTMGVV